MGFHIQEHPDVLDLILKCVRRPAPIANNGAERRDFRQQDLVNCMRVSSAFNIATAPILYKRVICDDLLRLLEGIGQCAVRSDVPSKLECLRYTRHFTLEYPDLDEHAEFRKLVSTNHITAADAGRQPRSSPSGGLGSSSSSGGVSLNEIKRRRAMLVAKEERVLADLETALGILATYYNVTSAPSTELRTDTYSTYPLRLDTFALGGNLSHVPEPLEVKASHGGPESDCTFPKRGFFWCAVRDLLWQSLIVPSQPRLICMHPIAQDIFLPCFQHSTTSPKMCLYLHVADWVNPPRIKPAPRGEIIIKHTRPYLPADQRDAGAKQNPFRRSNRAERLFAVADGRNVGCWSDDRDRRDLACKYLVEYSTDSLVRSLNCGAYECGRAELAERDPRAQGREHREKAAESAIRLEDDGHRDAGTFRDERDRCTVNFFISSDVPSRRQGVLSEEDQRKYVEAAWDKAVVGLSEQGSRLWDLRMGLLDEAPCCPACGA